MRGCRLGQWISLWALSVASGCFMQFRHACWYAQFLKSQVACFEKFHDLQMGELRGQDPHSAVSPPMPPMLVRLGQGALCVIVRQAKAVLASLDPGVASKDHVPQSGIDLCPRGVGCCRRHLAEAPVVAEPGLAFVFHARFNYNRLVA